MNRVIRRHMMTLDYGIVKLTGRSKAKRSGIYVEVEIIRGRKPGWLRRREFIPASNFI